MGGDHYYYAMYVQVLSITAYLKQMATNNFLLLHRHLFLDSPTFSTYQFNHL